MSLPTFLRARFFHSTTRLSHKLYDPRHLSQIQPTTATTTTTTTTTTATAAPLQQQPTRKHLEWMWERPDPVPLPKTVQQPIAGGSTVFHTLARRKPLYEYLPEDAPRALVEKVLPPPVWDSLDGVYGNRPLTADEQQQILRRKHVDGVRVHQVAVEFRCSKAQVVRLSRTHKQVVGDGDAETPLFVPKTYWERRQERMRATKSRRWKWFMGKRYAKAV